MKFAKKRYRNEFLQKNDIKKKRYRNKNDIKTSQLLCENWKKKLWNKWKSERKYEKKSMKNQNSCDLFDNARKMQMQKYTLMMRKSTSKNIEEKRIWNRSLEKFRNCRQWLLNDDMIAVNFYDVANIWTKTLMWKRKRSNFDLFFSKICCKKFIEWKQWSLSNV